MDIQKEREAFEAWLKSLNENGRTTYFLGQESTVAWEAWQARVPEGYVVVPVEPSDYMKCTVRDFGPDIEDYENMSKWDWEKLCAEIYKAMIEAQEQSK